MISVISWDVQWWGASVTKHPHCVCSSWPGRISSRFRHSVHRGCSDVVELKREMAEWQESVVFKHLEVILVGYKIKQMNRKQTSLWAPWNCISREGDDFTSWKCLGALHGGLCSCPVLGDSERQKGFFGTASLAAPSAGAEFSAEPASGADASLRAGHCHSKLQFSLHKALQCFASGVFGGWVKKYKFLKNKYGLSYVLYNFWLSKGLCSQLPPLPSQCWNLSIHKKSAFSHSKISHLRKSGC